MKLCDLAQRLALRVEGNDQTEVNQLASLETAQSGDLSFIVSEKYKETLRSTKASAVLIPEALVQDAPCAVIVCPSPYAAYAQCSWLLHPDVAQAPGAAANASVHASASVHPTASIGEFAVISASASIGANAVIGAHCFVGEGAEVGAHTRLMPSVYVASQCIMGEHCRVQSGAVIGSEGFGFAPSADGWQAIHQVGRVVIGNRVHIGANTTIDRGAIEDTEIHDGVILDNLIQIAHNIKIGENTAIAGCVGIAGSTVIGRNCQFGGACNIAGHLTIADGVVLNGGSTVLQSIEQSGRYGSAAPLLPVSKWRRAYAALSRIDELAKRVRKLERS